jgi:hypothetical protein
MEPRQITDMLAELHVQYIVMQTGYHDDVAAVKTLEAALGFDKFTEVARIPMYANYRNAVVAEPIVYRLNEDAPRGGSHHPCRSSFSAGRFDVSDISEIRPMAVERAQQVRQPKRNPCERSSAELSI